MERIARDAERLADRRNGIPLAEPPENLLPVFAQDALLHAASLAPAQHNPFAAAQGERLLGAHRDQVAFDFGHQPECETEHLAVDAVVEGIAVFGAVEDDLPPQAQPHDGHDLGERAAQPRELRDHERVARPQPAHQHAQLAVALVLAAAHRFGHPAVDGESPALGEAADFILLVFEVLFFRTDPKVCYNHNR